MISFLSILLFTFAPEIHFHSSLTYCYKKVMTSHLTLVRIKTSLPLDSIQGELYVNGLFFCHTIERLSKAVPIGCYPLGVSYSPRFKKRLPYLCVPKRTGIRIHAGNTSKDSKGCILVGKLDDCFTIINSRLTLNLLLSRLNNTFTSIIIK